MTVPVALALVEFAPVELTNPESLAADVDVLMPVTRPSLVIPEGKYREYRAAATNHEATLFNALTKK